MLSIASMPSSNHTPAQRSFRYFAALAALISVTLTAHGAEELAPFDAETLPPSTESVKTISRLDGAVLESGGFTEVGDLSGRTPNLTAATNGLRGYGDIFTLRGMGNTRFFSSPSVALYVDDVPYTSVFSYPTRLFDLSSIEVLRGPQGQFFGRNAEAGVLHLTTRPAGEEWGGRLTASYGSYDHYLGEVAVSGPLAEGLSFRFAGYYEERDGFMYNTTLGKHTDDQQSFGGRLGLDWQANAIWNLSLNVTAEDFDDGSQRFVIVGGDPFTVASDSEGRTEMTRNTLSLRARGQYDWGTITAVTSRQDWDLDPNFVDLDLGPFPGNTSLIEQDQETWTQEIRFDSAKGAPGARWSVGMFLLNSEDNGHAVRDFIVPIPDGFGGTIFLPVNEATDYELEEENYAAFANATIPFSEVARMTFGVRLDYTEKSISRVRTSTSPFGAPVQPVNDEESFFRASPSAGFEFDVSPDVTAFVRTSWGHKPGGFSAFASAPVSAEYDTERVWSNEIGLAYGEDGPLSLGVAFFWNDIENYQIERSVPGTISEYVVTTADQAETYGVEVEAAARPVEGLTLSAAFGYTEAELRTYSFAGTDHSGNDAPYIPEFTFTGAVQYEHTSGFFGRVEAQTFGDIFFDDTNNATGFQSGYTVFNAAVGYNLNGWEITAYGKNLTDREYYTNIVVNPPLFAGTPGEPQQFGVRVTKRF